MEVYVRLDACNILILLLLTLCIFRLFSVLVKASFFSSSPLQNTHFFQLDTRPVSIKGPSWGFAVMSIECSTLSCCIIQYHLAPRCPYNCDPSEERLRVSLWGQYIWPARAHASFPLICSPSLPLPPNTGKHFVHDYANIGGFKWFDFSANH